VPNEEEEEEEEEEVILLVFSKGGKPFTSMINCTVRNLVETWKYLPDAVAWDVNSFSTDILWAGAVHSSIN
jgi:hypothetical protein